MKFYSNAILWLAVVAVAFAASFVGSASQTKASAIQVEMIHSDEIKLPAEFQISLYENLVRQLEKQGGFEHVYRDGDRRAKDAADLVVLHSTVRGFKAGSERTRRVTTVAGATSVTIHCEFKNADGKVLSGTRREWQGVVLWRESASDLRFREENCSRGSRQLQLV